MNDQELTTLEQVRLFLEGVKPVISAIQGKEPCYAWIERTLGALANAIGHEIDQPLISMPSHGLPVPFPQTAHNSPGAARLVAHWQ